MSASRLRTDDSLRLGDVANDWRAAWLTPARDDAHPAVLAELTVDDTDHLIRIGRVELLALRQRCDELLAANPAGEVIEGEPTNERAVIGPGGRRVDISARRHGAPALDPWHDCTDDTCERQHWLKNGCRYHAAAGVPEPALAPHASLHTCVPAPAPTATSPRYARSASTPGCDA